MVPASSHKVPRVSWYSGYRLADSLFAYGAFTLSGWLSQNHSAKLVRSIPRSEPQGARTLVWALSISLAATLEIDVSFFSSGYLDVSVPRVPLVRLWIHRTMTGVRTCRVSPFGHLWINACLRLPTAFRSLPRPSSAISARASSLCSYSLDLFWLPHAPPGFPSGPCFHLCSLSCLLRSRFQSSSLSGFPSPRSRSQCASRFLLCAVFKERSQADA